jgi:hypothetical protein
MLWRLCLNWRFKWFHWRFTSTRLDLSVYVIHYPSCRLPMTINSRHAQSHINIHSSALISIQNGFVCKRNLHDQGLNCISVLNCINILDLSLGRVITCPWKNLLASEVNKDNSTRFGQLINFSKWASNSVGQFIWTEDVWLSRQSHMKDTPVMARQSVDGRPIISISMTLTVQCPSR